MKIGALVRLIIWSLVALLLIGILSVAMLAENINFIPEDLDNLSFGLSGETYKNASEYTAYSEPLSISEEIHSININWKDGKITVCAYDGDAIEIEETAVSDKDDRLRYRVKNGVLDIKYRKSEKILSIQSSPEKELTVKLPKAIAEGLRLMSIEAVSTDAEISGLALSMGLNISNVSGEYELSNIISASIDYEGVSGSLNATNCEFTDSGFETVSGGISIEGYAKEFEAETVSGDISLTMSSAPLSIETDSTSGNITLAIPENNGFTAELDSVSGDFNCEFEASRRGDEYIYKNGGAEYQFDSTSGDIIIKKK